MRSFLPYVVTVAIGLLLGACNEKNLDNSVDRAGKSVNAFYPYFYSYDTIPKVYVYRNIAHGMEEQYHRIFGILDSEGQHIVVEFYSEDGRLKEAYNYNVDSLNLIDHMVVGRNREKIKADLLKGQLMPMNTKDMGEFSSVFPGIRDSTFLRQNIQRKYSIEREMEILQQKTDAVVFEDHIVLEWYDPFRKLGNSSEGKANYYFAKGFGLVEWHTENKKAHYRLEKIISQGEFLRIMNGIQ